MGGSVTLCGYSRCKKPVNPDDPVGAHFGLCEKHALNAEK